MKEVIYKEDLTSYVRGVLKSNDSDAVRNEFVKLLHMIPSFVDNVNEDGFELEERGPVAERAAAYNAGYFDGANHVMKIYLEGQKKTEGRKE